VTVGAVLQVGLVEVDVAVSAALGADLLQRVAVLVPPVALGPQRVPGEQPADDDAVDLDALAEKRGLIGTKSSRESSSMMIGGLSPAIWPASSS
jgi:hypothetical protein